MPNGRLTAAQLEILRVLAEVVPRWRLCGGGALAGFDTRHRGTRDLDLLIAHLQRFRDDLVRDLLAASRPQESAGIRPRTGLGPGHLSRL